MTEPLLPCVELGPRATECARASVIWLHGLGANGHDFEPVVPHLGLPDVRFVFPHAPSRPVTINGGLVMPSWYDIRSLGDSDFREDRSQVAASQAQLEALIAREVERGTPHGRIVLAGFSQGGAVAAWTLTRFGERLAGLVCLSTYLIAPADHRTVGPDVNREVPAFVGHGTLDPTVPLAKGEALAEALRADGRELTWRTYPMGHSVSMEEIADLRRWLHARLAEVAPA